MRHTAQFISVVVLYALAVTQPQAAQLNSAPEGNQKVESRRLKPDHKTNTKGLNLSRAPETDELMSAGQLGGPLFPTHDLADKRRESVARWDFGRSIDEWNKHNYRQAVEMFRKHAKDFPDSPWADEAILHVGCDATYNGRYTEAETIFQELIARNKGKDYDGARMLLGKAQQRLGLLKVEQSNFAEASAQFSELLTNSPDWRLRTYASHWLQRISRYEKAREQLLTCGVDALAYAFEKEGRISEAVALRTNLPSSMRGHNLRQLKTLGSKPGRQLTAIQVESRDLQNLPLPAVLHIFPKNAGDVGHFWVLDKVQGENVELFDPQSHHRFQQAVSDLLKEWSGVALVFENSGSLPGRQLTAQELDSLSGGCCGAPAREDNMGPPDDNSGPPPGGPPRCPNGSPAWSINMMSMNLYMTDTPMWYEPAFGPSVNITVSYNSQSAIAHSEPFGNKWQFNYGSYLVVDTSGSVLIFMPGGRRDSYAPNGAGGYIKPFGIFNTLTRLAENHFELRFPDDTVYVYRIPPGSGSQQPFLTEILDAYGQKLSFGYDANVHLTSITDAQGKVFTLTYNPVGLCTNVADPFGRNAMFEYDASRNLTKITDMGGYWSAMTYDTNIYLASLSDDRGTWGFRVEPSDSSGANSDNYPPPGDRMWANYRITVTDPLGQKAEYMYYGGCDEYGCAGDSWYVSPRDYVEWESQTVNNYRSAAPKTRYLPTIINSGRRGAISRLIYPEGNSLQYVYDTTTGRRSSVNDGVGTVQYTYNSLGLISSITDALGTPTAYAYSTNGVDLLVVSNGLGPVKMTYNAQHRLTSILDRMSNVTAIVYHTNGLPQFQVDAIGVTNEFLYNTNWRMTSVQRASLTLKTFTYDSMGRVRTRTEATGLTVTNDYNNLNQVTRVTYPDGRFESYTYSTCCPRLVDSVTDRGGRTTSYIYDALKRLAQTVNPEGGVIRYIYDANGNLSSITDPNGNVTRFKYDLNNRVVQKLGSVLI